jgi:demethylmenaquinone methyltransferase/2-methoxy-6-polyprenyl-1,4-benzoquinol methylase
MTLTETPLPVAGGDAKRAFVREVFTNIAPRYDLLNHVLSLNADRRWRRKAVDALDWEQRRDGLYLDLCAGTRDLAAELGNRRGFTGRVVAADFVPAMLKRGSNKSPRSVPVVGFGVRNLMDLDAGLREAARVIKPGGRLVILEFSTPGRQPLRGLYLGYFRHVLPRIGRLVSKHRSAYDWLPASVLAFPAPAALGDRMSAAGFGAVHWRTLWGGIVALHTGVRSAL